MAAPIHVEWHHRPGWGEFGAWRIHGKHQGFDSYTLPKATVYGTAAGGKVIAIGYEAGGWGHYVDVAYPRYAERHCHLNERPDWLKVGDPVSASTALGRVGQTGNAKGIVWVRNGVVLWHVHSEVYLSTRVDFSKRTNPLPVWGATTAGGGTPIIIEPEQEDDDMLSFITYDGAGAWFVTDGITKRPLMPGEPQLLKDLGLRLTEEAAKGKVKVLGDLLHLIPDAVRVATLDVGAVVAAIRPLLGGGVDEGALARVLADALEPQFAAIHANIDDQPTVFKVTPN